MRCSRVGFQSISLNRLDGFFLVFTVAAPIRDLHPVLQELVDGLIRPSWTQYAAI